MDIRPLSPFYAVSPQITPDDLPAIAAAGYTMVINNRPDPEISAELHDRAMRQAAEKLGLIFISNPIVTTDIYESHIQTQQTAIDSHKGKILAYCASGNRSSIMWALSQKDVVPTDELISTPAKYGYNLEWLRDILNES